MLNIGYPFARDHRASDHLFKSARCKKGEKVNLRSGGLLLLLASIWGTAFLFIRIASPVLGPVLLVDARLLLAGILLSFFALSARRLPSFRGQWKAYARLGAINAAAPFVLIATAELHLTSSLAAMLNATTPLFTVIVAALWLRDPLTRRKVAGVLLGLVGVGVLVGWSPLPLTGTLFLSVGASLLAACCYAIGGVYSKVGFKDAPPLAIALGQQVAAGLLLLPVAALTLPAAWPSWPVVLVVLALAVFPTSIGYLLYFSLMKSAGPTATNSVTFLVPVFGLLWGMLFLHESFTPGSLLGLGIILVSLVLVTGLHWRASERSQPAQPAPVLQTTRTRQ
jgi:drug/metabolite transporter (DMT)-like permease